MNYTKDTWKIGNHEFTSRFILGSGKYSLDLIKAAVEQAGAQIITLALRRVNEGGAANILDYIPRGVSLLPNTSGARGRPRSRADRQAFQRSLRQRPGKDRDHAGYQISASGTTRKR